MTRKIQVGDYVKYRTWYSDGYRAGRVIWKGRLRKYSRVWYYTVFSAAGHVALHQSQIKSIDKRRFIKPAGEK